MNQHLRRSPSVKYGRNDFSDLHRKKRGHGISDLSELGRSVSKKYIAIRKSLKAGGLPDTQTPALLRYVVDERMSVLRYMTGDRHTMSMADLDPKSILKY